MKSQEVRTKFLDFFKSKNHLILPSAPMVLKNDPTLMFTNSGMAPFKEFFLGNSKPKKNRIADSQKCLRVSGKHNDIEEVGYDTYHHTMFEMLGNWSFGNYFKKEAISWAWELLTEIYKIDKDSLYVTIFEGDEKDGTKMDTEAYTLWKKHICEERILKGNKKDNFWEMGDQGPCGSCSEIHVDIRSKEEKNKIDGKLLVNKDHPQVIEVWNLVFIQYNRKANGSLEELPKKHIDTGMGFERLCMVLQDKNSSYDTDIFSPLIKEIEVITKTSYIGNEKNTVAIRVIADHIRAVAFAIADGQLPSNNGAGYVIRRILRRAIRYGFTFLKIHKPFIYKLIKILSYQMSSAFPEIKNHKKLVENVIKEEEISFLRTLDQGLVLLDRVIKNANEKEISGKKAFELYDTYGFPLDLTQLIAREKGLVVNENEFQCEMKKQKKRSRSASLSELSDWIIVLDKEHEYFDGYDNLELDVKITRYRKITTKKDGDQYQLVFNKTPFYPEGGGQVGDKGIIKMINGDKINVLDTKKENNIIIHNVKKLPKNIKESFRAIVDKNLRQLSSCNHTSTHLLHQALRTILGKHVEQKGSLVKPDYLRFDFCHFSKVEKEQLIEIENFVNDKIRENIPLIEKRNISMQNAIEQGAIALFGEKYGDSVRMISFGNSKELCGGTHVAKTSDIWHFKIKSESAVASGIRRIEAISNIAVSKYFENVEKRFSEIKDLLKNSKDLKKSILSLQDSNSSLNKQVDKLLKDKANYMKADIKNRIEKIKDVNFLAIKLDLDPTTIKNLLFELGNEIDNLFILCVSSNTPNKVMLTCYITKELAKDRGYDAGKIVRELSKYIHGGGGGQTFFATAGGKSPGGIPKVLSKVKEYI